MAVGESTVKAVVSEEDAIGSGQTLNAAGNEVESDPVPGEPSGANETDDGDECEGSQEDHDYEPSEEINEYNRGYQFADHDVVLVSSDNWLQFKVHAHRLQTGSQVFSDMINNSGRSKRSSEGKQIKEIWFTDDEIEDDDTINIFLNCLYNRWERYFKTGNDKLLKPNSLLCLLRFLDKYDCGEVRRTVCSTMRLSVMESTMSPYTAFVIGATCEDLMLCAAAIRMNTYVWTIDSPDTLRKGIKDAKVLDLRAASRASFKVIPLKYSHALLQATYTAETNKNGTMNWNAIAKEFERLLGEEQKAIEEEKAKEKPAEMKKESSPTP